MKKLEDFAIFVGALLVACAVALFFSFLIGGGVHGALLKFGVEKAFSIKVWKFICFSGPIATGVLIIFVGINDLLKKRSSKQGIKVALFGVDELKDQLPKKLELLDVMSHADLPIQWQARPSLAIEGVGETVRTITEKLQAHADQILQHFEDIIRIRTEIGITTAPGVSLPIWTYFRDGNSHNVINIVIRTGDDSFTYIWTP